MSKIKGQDIRLFLNNKCIGAATSCSLHIAAETEERASKDDVGAWSKYSISKKSWDISAEALVLSGYEFEKLTFSPELGTALSDKEITIGRMEVISMFGPKAQYVNNAISGRQLCLINKNTNSVLSYTNTNGELFYFNRSNIARTCIIAFTYYGHDSSAIGSEDFEYGVLYKKERVYEYNLMSGVNALELPTIPHVGDEVSIQLCVVNRTNPRKAENTIVHGVAIITDISGTAQNAGSPTLSLQLQGKGPLLRGSVPQNAPASPPANEEDNLNPSNEIDEGNRPGDILPLT